MAPRVGRPRMAVRTTEGRETRRTRRRVPEREGRTELEEALSERVGGDVQGWSDRGSGRATRLHPRDATRGTRRGSMGRRTRTCLLEVLTQEGDGALEGEIGGLGPEGIP